MVLYEVATKNPLPQSLEQIFLVTHLVSSSRILVAMLVAHTGTLHRSYGHRLRVAEWEFGFYQVKAVNHRGLGT